MTMAFWGVPLVTSPIWGTGVLLATSMMNDAGLPKRQKYQAICMMALVAMPVTQTYTIYKTYKYGFSNEVASIPIIPFAVYAASSFLAFL
ncbi:hypothetical protein DFA_06721 [Cavenderia fasciculata]|uniref:Transmembrane protein n=1 Tax=Cavenderia fasciculata TaxID=261658 RepID=F4Q234_CACFS|nr:uncharacterized protein DFA_06721 [Cavenderia fasciculata]EGG18054.1 hypothetical protein DFA_06721 [Cavenderia fasciculata]|eukprot:XP_004356947.1 hypothetical protein DFA_06721 [Cavenderia fasciculata]